MHAFIGLNKIKIIENYEDNNLLMLFLLKTHCYKIRPNVISQVIWAKKLYTGVIRNFTIL